MIKIDCFICQKELLEPGALVFSPPEKNNVEKYHICKNCWKEFVFDRMVEVNIVLSS